MIGPLVSAPHPFLFPRILIRRCRRSLHLLLGCLCHHRRILISLFSSGFLGPSCYFLLTAALLPVPMRLHTIVPEANKPLKKVLELHSHIRRILIEYLIVCQGFLFCGQSKPGYPGGDVIIRTLRVLVDVDESVTTNTWSKARRTLSKMLYEQGFEMFELESLDQARVNVLSGFLTTPEHPVITVYESSRGKIIEELMNSLRDEWTSLCLFSVAKPPKPRILQ